MAYLPRHIAPVSAQPSSRAPLLERSTKRWESRRIGGQIVCHPSHASLSTFSLPGAARIRVTSSMFLHDSGLAGSGHHLPLPYADSRRAMIFDSSSDSFGSDGVASTSDVFSRLSIRR